MTFLEAKNTLCNAKLNISYSGVAAEKIHSSPARYRGRGEHRNPPELGTTNFGLLPRRFTRPLPSTSGPTTIVTITNGNSMLYESRHLWRSSAVCRWIGEGAGKRNFTDFMKWMADYPTDNSKIWAEYSNNLYFNANAIANLSSYEIDVYGKSHCPRYSTTEGDNFGDSGHSCLLPGKAALAMTEVTTATRTAAATKL